MTDAEIIYSFYAAAAAVTAGLVFYFVRKKDRPANATPAMGSKLYEFGPEIRLRDLYKLAVEIEKEGEAFYLALAEKASRPETRELCLALAVEEQGHRNFFQSRLNQWRPLGVNVATWPAFVARVRQECLFCDPPGDGASEEEMAAYAIAQEARTAAFYAMFEPAFPDAWKRDEIRRMVAEEKSHEARLRAAYPSVKA